MSWVWTGVGVVLAAGVAAGVAAAVGAVVWRRRTRALLERLEAGAHVPPREGGAAGSSDVPPPVARYLERSLSPDGADIRKAVIRHFGSFRAGDGSGGWKPFRSTETFRTHPPAFVWDASIAMTPGVDVRVRDAYLDGEGVMKAALAGVLPVVDASPAAELTRGALFRYLAEAIWIPTRLLPGRGLTWAPVDDSTADATLTDGGVSATVRFRFDGAGDVVGFEAEARPREVEGRYEPTRWGGRCREPWEVGGFVVPRECEVAWMLPEGERVYWKGRIESAEYETVR